MRWGTPLQQPMGSGPIRWATSLRRTSHRRTRARRPMTRSWGPSASRAGSLYAGMQLAAGPGYSGMGAGSDRDQNIDRMLDLANGPESNGTWSRMGADGVPRVGFGVFGPEESIRSGDRRGFIDEIRSATEGAINQGSAIGVELLQHVQSLAIGVHGEAPTTMQLRSIAPALSGQVVQNVGGPRQALRPSLGRHR